MTRDMCATVRMEEGYMRMGIEYNNPDSRQKINNAIEKVEEQMQLHPSVIRRAISPEAGNFSIEFGADGEHREAGDFCEAVIKELGITHCES